MTILFYVHRKTVRYLDYGDLLDTEHGMAFSADCHGGKAFESFGFERGDFDKLLAEKREKLPEGYEIVEGEPVSRSHDMNPYGLI